MRFRQEGIIYKVSFYSEPRRGVLYKDETGRSWRVQNVHHRQHIVLGDPPPSWHCEVELALWNDLLGPPQGSLVPAPIFDALREANLRVKAGFQFWANIKAVRSNEEETGLIFEVASLREVQGVEPAFMEVPVSFVVS